MRPEHGGEGQLSDDVRTRTSTLARRRFFARSPAVAACSSSVRRRESRGRSIPTRRAPCCGSRRSDAAARSAGSNGDRRRTSNSRTCRCRMRSRAGAGRRVVRAEADDRRTGLDVTPLADRQLPEPARLRGGAVGRVERHPRRVFSGTTDGVMRAYATSDGHVLWEYNTAHEYSTVNGVAGKGGAINGPGPVIAGECCTPTPATRISALARQEMCCSPSGRSSRADHFLGGHMSFSRRRFMQWAASASTLAIVGPGRTEFLPLLAAGESGFRPELLPTQKEIWDHEVWMAGLGPKYTGNKAHVTFVEFLATEMKSLGLDVGRERYTLPRWEARRWEITITQPGGMAFKAPVTSYFPYSGQTPSAGATGEMCTREARRRSSSMGSREKLRSSISRPARATGAPVQGVGRQSSWGGISSVGASGAWRRQRSHAVPEGGRRRRHHRMERRVGRQRRRSVHAVLASAAGCSRALRRHEHARAIEKSRRNRREGDGRARGGSVSRYADGDDHRDAAWHFVG